MDTVFTIIGRILMGCCLLALALALAIGVAPAAQAALSLLGAGSYAQLAPSLIRLGVGLLGLHCLFFATYGYYGHQHLSYTSIGLPAWMVNLAITLLAVFWLVL